MPHIKINVVLAILFLSISKIDFLSNLPDFIFIPWILQTSKI